MALSVPLSRFTSRVGGGSAFFVRRLRAVMLKNIFRLFMIAVWTFASIMLGSILLGGIYAVFSDDRRSPDDISLFGVPVILIIMVVFGLLGLLPSIFGKLPGTRKRSADSVI